MNSLRHLQTDAPMYCQVDLLTIAVNIACAVRAPRFILIDL